MSIVSRLSLLNPICMRSIQFLVTIGISLFLISCASMAKMPLDVMRPASFSVSPDILSVVVVDYSYPYRADSVNLIVLPSETIVVDTILVDDFGWLAVQAMTDVLNKREFFDSVKLHQTPLNKPPFGVPFQTVPARTINELALENNAQAVIALENVRYKSKINALDMGSYYYITLDASGELFWKLYDLNGDVIDVYLQRDSIFWDNAVGTHGSQPREVPAIRDAIETLAYFMGRNYPDRISPHWETSNRYFYIGGHHLFARANDLRKANNWSEAAKVWYYVYEHGNKLQKARAAHNLALSFEVRGDFDEAIAWSNISYKMFEEMSTLRVSATDKHMTRLYNLELINRLYELQKLQEQLGGVN